MMEDINNALLHIKAKHNGEIPYKYGSQECAKLMHSYAEEYHKRKLKLLGVSGRHLWLDPDDLEFAKALQEENRLEAVKWLCEKARLHTLTPLKDAKEILDAYR